MNNATALKGWHEGWPSWNLLPIRTVLDNEKEAARALIQQAQEDERKAALDERARTRQHALDSRKQEGQMVALARTGALQAQAVGNKMIGAIRKLTDKAVGMIETMAASAGGPKCPTCGVSPAGEVTLSSMISHIERVTRMQGSISAISLEALEMERFHLGDPGEALKLDAIPDEISFEEVEIHIHNATQAVERAKVRRLTLLQGGSSEGVSPGSNPSKGVGADTAPNLGKS